MNIYQCRRRSNFFALAYVIFPHIELLHFTQAKLPIPAYIVGKLIDNVCRVKENTFKNELDIKSVACFNFLCDTIIKNTHN